MKAAGAGNTYRRFDGDDDTKILQTLTRDHKEQRNEENIGLIEENVENNQLIVDISRTQESGNKYARDTKKRIFILTIKLLKELARGV